VSSLVHAFVSTPDLPPGEGLSFLSTLWDGLSPRRSGPTSLNAALLIVTSEKHQC
jgi:hypothetical protein